MKKIVTLLLALTMSFTIYASNTILPQENIPLLKEDSAEVIGLNSLKILLGRENGFELESSITRAEAVVLLMRMHPENLGALGMPSPEFDDMDGHWAYKEVTAAKKMGLINGTSSSTFTPDRPVSGREFAKMMLCLLGYENITIENAFEFGEKCDLISNNYTRSVVYDNRELMRSDAVRLCWSALASKTSDGELLYKKLAQSGKYKEDDFYGILIVAD